MFYARTTQNGGEWKKKFNGNKKSKAEQ